MNTKNQLGILKKVLFSRGSHFVPVLKNFEETNFCK